MKFLKNTFYVICYYTGIINLFYWLNRNKQIVVNYHHILPEEAMEDNMIYSYSHSLEVFKKQLQMMKKRFEFTTEVGKPGTVLLTFDDGAINNYKYALPVLEEMNIKAYFFVIDSMVNAKDGELLWVDKWILWFSNVPYGKYRILDEEVLIQNEMDREKARFHFWNKILNNYRLKEIILEDLKTNYSFTNFDEYILENSDRFNFLSLHQIESMKSAGHKIGYHGMNHDILRKIPIEELQMNLQRIKENKIYNSNAFAIPFGTDNEMNEQVLSTLSENQFSPIFLNYAKSDKSGSIGRINLPNDTNSYRSNYYLSGLNIAIR